MTEVNLAPDKLVKYLRIAENQRNRAAKKFVDDYGPTSNTVKEVNAEIAELSQEINRLVVVANTPVEQHIQKEKEQEAARNRR